MRPMDSGLGKIYLGISFSKVPLSTYTNIHQNYFIVLGVKCIRHVCLSINRVTYAFIMLSN